ncbi:MAG: 50S ribosomal protein L6 [Ruminococcaceae bacterium]|nr:50S ribosomal protein L6 [Oscillospiraceae bacterium]
MSRIGRLPITVPAGVEVKLDGATLTVKGKNGTLTQTFHPDMIIKVDAGVITVERPSEEKAHKALHGLTRTLIANMIEGVTEGYKKELEVVGVGYRVSMAGTKLILELGYSHKIEMEQPAGIKFEVQESKITVSGADKQQVGQVAAEVRSKRPPEPFHGKGVKYVDEHIRRKSGKAGK